jgi:AcrR family transcriptional regulator
VRASSRLDGPARREAILRVALPAFASAGYERTRVADIAARVGVTEPVVFQNFGAKAELFAAVLERAAEEVAGHVERLSAHASGAAEALERLLSSEHQDQMHSPGGLGSVFLEATRHPEPTIKKAARRAHARSLEALAQLIRRGQREGSLRNDVEAHALAALALSQIHARQVRRAYSQTSSILESDLARAIRNVMGAH